MPAHAFQNNTAVRFEGHGNYERLRSIFKTQVDEWSHGKVVSIQYLSSENVEDGCRAYGVVIFPSANLPNGRDMGPRTEPGTWWSFDTNFRGLTTLSDGKNAVKMDICFIHGLNGHAFETWTSRRGAARRRSNFSSPEVVTWIQDFLPGKFNHECRIMTYGFDAELLGDNKDEDLSEWAETFLRELQKDRRRLNITQERPITFVAYSMGGLVARQAIEILDRKRFTGFQSPEFSRLAVPSCGIIFLGTPHGGSRLAGSRLVAAAANLWGPRTSRIVRMLSPDSTDMENNTRIWKDVLHWYCPFLCFVEAEKTSYGFLGRYEIVSRKSASFLDRVAIPLPKTNHRTICAYHHEFDEGFLVLFGHIGPFWYNVSNRQAIEKSIAERGPLRTSRLPGHNHIEY